MTFMGTVNIRDFTCGGANNKNNFLRIGANNDTKKLDKRCD